MKFLSAFVLAAILCQVSFADDQPAKKPPPVPAASQQILGVDKPVRLGELVDLSVRCEPASKDVVAFSTDWSVFDLETRKEQAVKFYREGSGVDEVQGIVFGAGVDSREVLVHCSVTYLILKKDGDKIVEAGTKTEMLKSKMLIGQGQPKPPVPPPSPAPDVKFPDEKLGLSSVTYKSVMERGPPKKVEGAKALATSLRGINSAIAAGAIKDPVDILKQVTASNQSAINKIGLSRDDWLPTFTVIQDALFALYEQGKISAPSQFGEAFLEIANGFDAVR